MQRLSILGSTGSIGRSALNLVDSYRERLRVVALAARSSSKLLYEQCVKYRPELVALFDSDAARTLAEQLPGTKVVSGQEGLNEVACSSSADVVLSSITGAAGLIPTYCAIKEGKKIALANKESLVTAGELLIPLVHKHGATLIPVDSEHSALHQCLRGSSQSEVGRLLLTASGGSFLDKSKAELAQVTIQQTLNHPTWDMGPKITVDSATLMNKGLEVIEAHHFFGIEADQISVVVHPQSVVHSIVEFIDGTMLAQLSITDMRTSILYAVAYPERWQSRLPELDLFSLGELNFRKPDTDKFPCLKLAYQALRDEQSYPAVLNAANEVAVELFLSGKLPFQKIAEIIDSALEAHTPRPISDINTVLEVDRDSPH
jgi:1-deoxy-D-xylulose-5-phosphate reductoisomerase